MVREIEKIGFGQLAKRFESEYLYVVNTIYDMYALAFCLFATEQHLPTDEVIFENGDVESYYRSLLRGYDGDIDYLNNAIKDLNDFEFGTFNVCLQRIYSFRQGFVKRGFMNYINLNINERFGLVVGCNSIVVKHISEEAMDDRQQRNKGQGINLRNVPKKGVW